MFVQRVRRHDVLHHGGIGGGGVGRPDTAAAATRAASAGFMSDVDARVEAAVVV
jgi:hypothetical protein